MTGAIVVMGASGCGKSTLGRALADALGWRFVEGDGLHPPANIAKMAAGEALTDDDREPFLANVAAVIARHSNEGVVVTCSALRKHYRDRIRQKGGAVCFVLPLVPRPELAERLQARQGHFMPASLLDSQLDTLEMPEADEHVIVLDGTAGLSDQVDRVKRAL